MANKRKVSYDVFARLIVPENVDANKIASVLHRAASSMGWDFSASVEEELDSEVPSLHELIEEDDD